MSKMAFWSLVMFLSRNLAVLNSNYVYEKVLESFKLVLCQSLPEIAKKNYLTSLNNLRAEL